MSNLPWLVARVVGRSTILEPSARIGANYLEAVSWVAGRKSG